MLRLRQSYDPAAGCSLHSPFFAHRARARVKARAVLFAKAPLLVLLVTAACEGDPGDRVAAAVNGYRVTYAELDKYVLAQDLDSTSSSTEEDNRMLQLNLLRELIDRQIMLDKAQRLGLMAVDAEVEDRFQSYRSPYDSDAALEEHLRTRRMTVAELKSELRRSLTIEKLLNVEISSKVRVGEAELRGYYEENQANFHLPEQQLHMAWILVTARPETPVPNRRNDDAQDLKTAQEKIEMLERRVANGEDFGTLAQNYSEDPVSTANGGDLGFIPQSSLEQIDLRLRRVVASLSPGDVSPVVKTGDEFRIIKLISIEHAGQREYSDPRVQQRLRGVLRNRKEQLLKAAYLEVARNEAAIENFLAHDVVGDFGASD